MQSNKKDIRLTQVHNEPQTHIHGEVRGILQLTAASDDDKDASRLDLACPWKKNLVSSSCIFINGYFTHLFSFLWIGNLFCGYYNDFRMTTMLNITI